MTNSNKQTATTFTSKLEDSLVSRGFVYKHFVWLRDDEMISIKGSSKSESVYFTYKSSDGAYYTLRYSGHPVFSDNVPLSPERGGQNKIDVGFSGAPTPDEGMEWLLGKLN